ncbi:hypothetical protein ACQR1I_36245 [Bradyrhizobium sp. HKCCYLS2038]|uniref:hypothetical protein n=1 Tax=Bradyrhizobium sp. HKCCYLS2038 TaxID=3420764 RepID=UPI003EBA9BFD
MRTFGLGLGLDFATGALLGGVAALVPPTGFVFVVDSNGAYVIDTDGAYLIEAA